MVSTYDELMIVNMPFGGFIIKTCGYGDNSRPIFASTSIEEALDYIKREIGKVPGQCGCRKE